MSAQSGALKGALADAETAGGVLSLANPEGVRLLVTRLVIDLTTAADGAGTVDAGIAANGTTSNDTLIDGLDVNTAAGVFDNVGNGGTNGDSVAEWGADEFLTVSAASGAAAGLEGNAYIEYIRAG